ncbi:MAG: ABC transporter ATP-binding protein/permease [Propionibacteriaceae bacterium]|nr:ABC transporter ATP-binding protein/permease [Propionibacteriaceae bacterium]
MLGRSKNAIVACVLLRYLALAGSVWTTVTLARLLGQLVTSQPLADLPGFITAVTVATPVRFACLVAANQLGHRAARQVKSTLRRAIFAKMIRLGVSHTGTISTAEALQLSTEGVEQLDIYFGRYLPQLFYCLLAPMSLFAVMSFSSLQAGLTLLACVPLIPIAIVAVQRFAKRLFHTYWGEYVGLAERFLDNVQGLTTLKIYQADEARNIEMNRQAQRFRAVTMRVLTMQLNSITVMDLVAYGGAALGTLIAVHQLAEGDITAGAAITVLLLCAEFFIPLRRLGSYFHIAMNGMASSKKIFALLDLPEAESKQSTLRGAGFQSRDLSYSYDGSRDVLTDVRMDIPPIGLTAIVGQSGSGKSTIAAALTGRLTSYRGSLTVGGVEIRDMDPGQLLGSVMLIDQRSHLFAATVRDNLLLACPTASDDRLIHALDQVGLWQVLAAHGGLDALLTENGVNLSGGQRQRLALCRALLFDAQTMIFDEATSNIDVESENAIMEMIHELARTKAIILICHRLANVVTADRIWVMDHGRVAQAGAHRELLAVDGPYRRLWDEQYALEQFRRPQETLA